MIYDHIFNPNVEKIRSDIFYSSQEDDFGELVFTIYKQNKELTIPKRPVPKKSEFRSTDCRKLGNIEYAKDKIWDAYLYYNVAVASAPENSESLALAYSNRSMVLFKMQKYQECLKNIEYCFEVGCPVAIKNKLKERQKDCLSKCNNKQRTTQGKNFLKLESIALGRRHPEIPCVSNDVKIVINPSTKLPKITAGKDIKVGTVIGVETAFSSLHDYKQFDCCHYCHKMSLCLIPCPTCCFALFCDKNCLRLSMMESHKIECQLTGLLHDIDIFFDIPLALITVLKIKSLCTWDMFVEASLKMGENGMKNSSISEIYDENKTFSILNSGEKGTIMRGLNCHNACHVALVINELDKIPDFFPSSLSAKHEAIKSVGRMMMNIRLKFLNKVGMFTGRMIDDRFHMPKSGAFGYFAFASKLKHSCDPNILHVALNKKVILIATRPIEKGAELTLNFVGSALYSIMQRPKLSLTERVIKLYYDFGEVCRCPICTDTWFQPLQLTKKQRDLVFSTVVSVNHYPNLDDSFKRVCEAITLLHDVRRAPEYGDIKNMFHCLILNYMFMEGNQNDFE